MTMAEYIMECIKREDMKQSNTLLHDIIDAEFIQKCMDEYLTENEKVTE